MLAPRALVLSSLCSCAIGAEPHMPETFGDGGFATTAGWTANDGGADFGAGVGGSGALDHALVYAAANPPPAHNGFHMLHPMGGATPNPVFQGDYPAAGIVAIQFYARHSGTGSDVVLRATIFDTFDDGIDFVVSDQAVTITSADTGWATYVIPIGVADVTAGGTNGFTPDDILSAVVQIGLRHDPDGFGPLTPAAVDNPTSVVFDAIVLLDGPACPADLAPPGGNGAATVDDIDAFVTFFLAGELLADCDGSGTVTVDDIDCFVNSFLAGCP